MSTCLNMTVDIVEVYLHKLNVPMRHPNAQTYEKGHMFCVREIETGKVFKYPIQTIYRIVESYGSYEWGRKKELWVDEEGNPP